MKSKKRSVSTPAKVHEKTSINLEKIFKKEEILSYEEFIQSFDKRVEEMLSLFKEDQFVKCYIILDMFERCIEAYKNDHGEEESFKSCMQILHDHSDSTTQIRNRGIEIKDILNTFNDENQHYILGKNKNGLKTQYKPQTKENPIMSFKVESVIDAPLTNLLLVANEMDLSKNIFSSLKNAEIVKETNKFSKIMYVKMSVPLLSDRDAYLFGYGVNLLDDDCVLLVARDVNSTEMQDVPKPKGRNVRVKVYRSAFLFKVIDEKTTSFNFIGDFEDPKLKVIPSWLINWAVKTMAPMFFNVYKKETMNLSEVYQKRLLEKQEFYSQIKKNDNKESKDKEIFTK